VVGDGVGNGGEAAMAVGDVAVGDGTAGDVAPGGAASADVAKGNGDADLRASDGRVPGRRGLLTRARLLAQTRDLLDTTSYRDLRVVDIARAAGMSPATFYQYFPDAESALLALADELVGEGRERLTRDIKAGPWTGKEAYETCERVASAFLAFWADHGALMAVIDLAAMEGDQRFRDIRTTMLNAVSQAITAVVEDQRDRGRLPSDLDVTATSAVLVAMLAQTSAHQYGITHYGTTVEGLARAMARQLYSAMTGRKPPS
jgi:AcrR family transcriptional regulator